MAETFVGACVGDLCGTRSLPAAVLAAVLFSASVAIAQPLRPDAPRLSSGETPSLNEWLTRAQSAPRKVSYVGTFVVSSGGAMSSSRVSHAYEGEQQIERVETLSGPPRLIFRHNDLVVTFLLDKKIVRTEQRDPIGPFPESLNVGDRRIADFYQSRHEGVERVAGVEADVTSLVPKDALRFGYRIWTERTRGLMVKSQTLGAGGGVLEQAAFSELQLDAPVRLDKLAQMMANVEGYRIEKTAWLKSDPSAEGWSLRVPVPGFVSLRFYKHPAGTLTSVQGKRLEALQWIFSDGIASLSIFIEPLDPSRHAKESSFSVGATQTVTRQVAGYWLTLVGEVPMATLKLFADNVVYSR